MNESLGKKHLPAVTWLWIQRDEPLSHPELKFCGLGSGPRASKIVVRITQPWHWPVSDCWQSRLKTADQQRNTCRGIGPECPDHRATEALVGRWMPVRGDIPAAPRGNKFRLHRAQLMPAGPHVGWSEAAPTGAGKSATVKTLLQHGDNTTTSNKRTARLPSDRAYRPLSAPRHDLVVGLRYSTSSSCSTVLAMQTNRKIASSPCLTRRACVRSGRRSSQWGHVVIAENDCGFH
jgi:hypothetical protein